MSESENETAPFNTSVLLSEEEMQTIMLRTVEASDRPLTQEEILSVVRWALATRIDHTMLELLLDGKMVPVVPEDPEQPLLWKDAAPRGEKASGQ